MVGRNGTVTEYGRGKNGTRTQVVEEILKPDGNRINAQVDYEYDDLYRLVHEHRIAYGGGDAGVTYEYNFAYDAAGNRTAWQVAGGNMTYYHHDSANKVLDYGSSNTPPYSGNATVAYDVKGNTTQIVSGAVTTTYTWDFLNRMREWAKTGATTEAYLYNADGMRVRKTPSGGTATDFMLDRKEIAEEITGSSDISYVGPGLISQISDSTRTIYHADGIGSTRAMSGDGAVITEAGVYDAYGNLLISSGSVPSFGYAGQYRYYTDATGLGYREARYYDAATGRFTSGGNTGWWDRIKSWWPWGKADKDPAKQFLKDKLKDQATKILTPPFDDIADQLDKMRGAKEKRDSAMDAMTDYADDFLNPDVPMYPDKYLSCMRACLALYNYFGESSLAEQYCHVICNRACPEGGPK